MELKKICVNKNLTINSLEMLILVIIEEKQKCQGHCKLKLIIKIILFLNKLKYNNSLQL